MKNLLVKGVRYSSLTKADSGTPWVVRQIPARISAASL